MIDFESVTIRYTGATAPVLVDVDLHVAEGELCLVAGATGSGKSTLLGAVNGLVPHFTGGTLQGRVRVGGRDTAEHPPRELADVVGVVGQDARAGFVTDVVEDELAYGMESLGVPPDVMRRRVEETMDLLGIAPLRARALSTLSGGEAQRVAIGSVLTMHPAVLVLDEPTSALDPTAAEEVLATLQRLVHDLGLTVLVAEHRLERVLPFADRIASLTGDGRITAGTPAAMLTAMTAVPPVVELGRLAGWEPLPLSVRDARRRAGPLRARLPDHPPALPGGDHNTAATPVAALGAVAVDLGGRRILREVDLALRPGEIVALMGRNGAGKSTLLRTLAGMHPAAAGRVRVADRAPIELAPRDLIGEVGLVPQEPADLLYADTLARECAAADREAGAAEGRCRRLLVDLVGDLDPTMHPRDLSEGQRLGLVLAVVLTAAPGLLLLDEPTRGLDYVAKRALIATLRRLAGDGTAILLATHDVELAAALAHRTVVIADGDVLVDGPTCEVVVGSPAFAPQIAKILAPSSYLTIEQVAAGLAVGP